MRSAPVPAMIPEPDRRGDANGTLRAAAVRRFEAVLGDVLALTEAVLRRPQAPAALMESARSR
jgi:hypothetical protein